MTRRDEFLLASKVDENTGPGGFQADGREPLSARDEDGSVTCTVMRTGAALNYFRFSRDCAVKGHAGTWGAARIGGEGGRRRDSGRLLLGCSGSGKKNRPGWWREGVWSV